MIFVVCWGENHKNEYAESQCYILETQKEWEEEEEDEE